MEYKGHMIPGLRELPREWGVRGYLGKRKAELITMLRDCDSRPPGCGEPQPPPQLQSWEPTRPPPLPQPSTPTQKTDGRPKPKKIKWLEKKKHNLENQI